MGTPTQQIHEVFERYVWSIRQLSNGWGVPQEKMAALILDAGIGAVRGLSALKPNVPRELLEVLGKYIAPQYEEIEAPEPGTPAAKPKEATKYPFAGTVESRILRWMYRTNTARFKASELGSKLRIYKAERKGPLNNLRDLCFLSMIPGKKKGKNKRSDVYEITGRGLEAAEQFHQQHYSKVQASAGR